jgi:hypothetical protein
MTGNRDYLLRVVAADLSSYEAFLKNKLTRLDGIASIESSFALSQVKYSIALPVCRLCAARQRLSSPAHAGYPVRRGLSVQSLLPLEYWITRLRG